MSVPAFPGNIDSPEPGSSISCRATSSSAELMTASAPTWRAFSSRDGIRSTTVTCCTPNRFESHCRAEPKRTRTEYDNLVRGSRRNLVHAVSRDGHRLVQRGYFERYVVGHNLEAFAPHGVL